MMDLWVVLSGFKMSHYMKVPQPPGSPIPWLPKDACERCLNKTRRDLCNELGDYRVAIESIREVLRQVGSPHYKSFADLFDDLNLGVCEALSTLEEAIEQQRES